MAEVSLLPFSDSRSRELVPFIDSGIVTIGGYALGKGKAVSEEAVLGMAYSFDPQNTLRK